MNDELDPVEIQLTSSAWYAEQATKLIAEYENCPTEHAKSQLIPKLRHIYNKLSFERRAIIKLHDLLDGEGEDWKNGNNS